MTARAITLAIETSNPTAGAGSGVALVSGASGAARVIDREPVARPTRDADDLLPAIDRLCRRAGVEAGAIARVAVSVGPGGFTGLRMAVSAATMIAEAVGAERVAVPTALVAAHAVPTDRRPARFAVALASKGETAHVTLMTGDCVMEGAGSVMTAGAVPWGGVGLLVGDGHLPASFRAKAGEAGVPILPPGLDAGVCGVVSLGLPAVGAEGLVPIYSREAYAVPTRRAERG